MSSTDGTPTMNAAAVDAYLEHLDGQRVQFLHLELGADRLRTMNTDTTTPDNPTERTHVASCHAMLRQALAQLAEDDAEAAQGLRRALRDGACLTLTTSFSPSTGIVALDAYVDMLDGQRMHVSHTELRPVGASPWH